MRIHLRSLNKYGWVAIAALVLLLLASLAARLGLAASSGATTGTVSHLDISIAKTFKSWGELKGASALIVLGTAGAQQSQTGDHGFPWTTTTIHLDRILRGSAPTSQTLLVRQVGGAAGGTVEVADEFPLLSPGTRYLLFLTLSPIAGQWYPVGAFQGAFTVSTDGRVNSFVPGGTAGGINVHDQPLDKVIQAVLAAPALKVSP